MRREKLLHLRTKKQRKGSTERNRFSSMRFCIIEFSQPAGLAIEIKTTTKPWTWTIPDLEALRVGQSRSSQPIVQCGFERALEENVSSEGERLKFVRSNVNDQWQDYRTGNTRAGRCGRIQIAVEGIYRDIENPIKARPLKKRMITHFRKHCDGLLHNHVPIFHPWLAFVKLCNPQYQTCDASFHSHPFVNDPNSRILYCL